MTTKEIAEAAGVSVDTVTKVAKENYSAKYSQGARVRFTQKESIDIMSRLRKKGFVELPQNTEELPQNTEVTRIDRLESMVEKLISAVATMPAIMMKIAGNNQKQIDFVQDYFTIKGYSSKNRIQITYSDAVKFGKEAVKISNERGIEIRKADDENYGRVNSYHIEVLNEVFSL